MQQDDLLNNKIIDGWYKYTALRPGFVGYALKIIREHTNKTLEEQKRELGVDEKLFLRLQGMPLPRSNSLSNDAYRIAMDCKLTNPFVFVKVMILANKIEKSNQSFTTNEFYQAAFDEEEDLDNYPSED